MSDLTCSVVGYMYVFLERRSGGAGMKYFVCSRSFMREQKPQGSSHSSSPPPHRSSCHDPAVTLITSHFPPGIFPTDIIRLRPRPRRPFLIRPPRPFLHNLKPSEKPEVSLVSNMFSLLAPFQNKLLSAADGLVSAGRAGGRGEGGGLVLP